MTFTRHQGMQYVSKEQFEVLRQALWTVQLGTVNAYNTTFWKNVAKDGFEGFLNGIDEYENHSARSVRFVHDMDPEHRVSTFFSRIEVDFVRKMEPMLLEEHVPA
eukprot:1626256-Amphidinium_carterae.1